MDTIMLKREFIDELTTLEKALQAYIATLYSLRIKGNNYHKDEFLAIKKSFLDESFDEKLQ